jgi:hypothetical protein
MTKALIVPFFHYYGTSEEISLSLFNFFLKYLFWWKDRFDKIYIIDSGGFIPEVDFLTIIKVPRRSHWENLNDVLSEIKEDCFLLVDSDTIIYRPSTIDDIFKKIEKNHIVSILDNSGGKNLESKYKFLRKNKNRDYRRRFAPYLFACRTNFFRKLDKFDFTPTGGDGWTDSMGIITDRLLSFEPTIEELPDDRTTIYYNDGENKVSQWLDSPEYNWSKTNNPNYGYYHLRNAGGALFGLNSYLLQNEAWDKFKEITPINELYRLLTWAHFITGKDIPIVPDSYINKYKKIYKWL